MKRLISGLFLLLGVLIGSGAFGHSFMGRLAVDAQLDKFPIEQNVYTLLYVTWYFISGCMLLFGVTIVLAWLHLRRGERDFLVVTALIGVLYFCAGVGGMVYRHGDPFMAVFIFEGGLLPVCSWALRATHAAPRAT